MKEGTLIKPNGDLIAVRYDYQRDRENNIWVD
jgi:hypothetical protein